MRVTTTLRKYIEPMKTLKTVIKIIGGILLYSLYAPPPRRGTSYTAPAIAGLCASLLEYKRMSRIELINLLHTSGLNSSAPNHEIGYGVPQTSRMLLQFN